MLIDWGSGDREMLCYVFMQGSKAEFMFMINLVMIINVDG